MIKQIQENKKCGKAAGTNTKIYAKSEAFLVVALVVFSWLIVPSKAEVSVRGSDRRTCVIPGQETDLEVEYKDEGDTVKVVRWYDGQEAGNLVGTYETETGIFTPGLKYEKKVKPPKTYLKDGYNVISLPFVNFESSDAGMYTILFTATSETKVTAWLDVVATSDLGRREFCVDTTVCYQQLNGSTQLYERGNITFQYTKTGNMSCDIFIDVVTSTGVSCDQVQADYVAKCFLGNSATLVDTEFINGTVTYGKNGRPFHTEAFQIKFLTAVTSSSTVPAAVTSSSTVLTAVTSNCAVWKHFAIGLVIAIAIVLLAVLVAAYRWYREKPEKPEKDPAYARVPASDPGAFEMAEQTYPTSADDTDEGQQADPLTNSVFTDSPENQDSGFVPSSQMMVANTAQ